MKITLHRASVDNAGNFLDAGTEIVVGPADDHLHADRAGELLDTHGAVEVVAATKVVAKPAAKKPSAKKKAPAKAQTAPAPTLAPVPSADPVAPAADEDATGNAG